MPVQTVQEEIGLRLVFSSCAVNAVALRLPDARQAHWSYSTSLSDVILPMITLGCKKSVYFGKYDYRVSQCKVKMFPIAK